MNGMKNSHNLLDAYLKFHKVRVVSPSRSGTRDGMVFTPMFIMDAMNMIYEEYIDPLVLKHKEKLLRSRWHDSYEHYIKTEFCAFNDDQKVEICDLMDEFGSFIHNEVEVFRATVMSKFMKYDTDIRLVISATLSCNVLAQAAQIIHKAQYHCENRNIAGVESWSLKFLNAYADKHIDRSSTQTNLNLYKDVDIACKRICKSIVNFAKQCDM